MKTPKTSTPKKATRKPAKPVTVRPKRRVKAGSDSRPAPGSEAPLSDRKSREVKAAFKLVAVTAALRALVDAFEPLAAQIMSNLDAPQND